MKITSIALGAFCLLGLFACSRNAKPDLRLSPYVYEINVASRDSIYEGFTVVSNQGRQKLIIDYANGGCSCTKVTLDKKGLGYKDSTELKFTYNPEGKRSGTLEEWIVISANTDSLVHLMKLVVHINE